MGNVSSANNTNNTNNGVPDPSVKFGIYDFICKGANGDDETYILNPAFGADATPMRFGRGAFEGQDLINYIKYNRIVVSGLYVDDFDDLCYEPFNIDDIDDSGLLDGPIYIDADIINSVDMRVNLKFRTVKSGTVKNFLSRGEKAGRIPSVEGLYYMKYNDTLFLISEKPLKLVNKSLSTGEPGVFKYSFFSSIDLSGLDLSEITDMTDMFYYSYATSIILGKTLDFSNVKNMHHAYYCSNLKDLTFRDIKFGNIDGLEDAFEGSRIRNIDFHACVISEDALDKIRNTKDANIRVSNSII